MIFGEIMRSAIAIARGTVAVVMLLTASSIAEPAFGATNADGQVIQVQHVHLVGQSIPAFHKGIMDLRIRQCAGQGHTVAPPPPGTPLHETIDDDYYAPGGVSSHSRTKIYFIGADCRLASKETLKITTWDSTGACITDRETRRSTGYCDVDIASLSRSPDPKSVRKNIFLDGETKVIAGHSCKVLHNSYWAATQKCIATEGVFANVVTRLTMSYGALLRMDFRSSPDKDAEFTTKEATEIHTNIMIPITTFAPQLSGEYKVYSVSLPQRDSRE
ncbi:MAG: hypothetical protein ACI9ZF_002925 [Bradyrhizobium sp.]|jgi:hypothetical protein